MMQINLGTQVRLQASHHCGMLREQRSTMSEMANVWVDPNDRVDSVEIRYTWSSIGTEPDWTNGKDEAEVMHVVLGTNPKLRQAIIEIPRYLDGKDNYLLHYHFGGGGEHHEGF